MIRDTKILKGRFTCILFQHSNYSKDRLANLIATESLKRREAFYLLGTVPHFATEIQIDEYVPTNLDLLVPEGFLSERAKIHDKLFEGFLYSNNIRNKIDTEIR